MLTNESLCFPSFYSFFVMEVEAFPQSNQLINPQSLDQEKEKEYSVLLC